MQIAKADKGDIKSLSEYLLKAEKRNASNFPHGWRRVVWAADILIDNCCDPNVDHLELKPEFKRVQEPKTP